MTTPIGATGTTGTTGTKATTSTNTASGTGTNATAGTGTNALSGTTTTTSSVKSKTQMDKDLFLKLLVAQMKYQDPTKPTDTAQFLSQTAQFTQVEKMEQIAEAQVGLLSAQLRQTATTFVGKTVTYKDSAGTEATGKVTAADLTDAANPTLRIGTTDVPLSSIKQVSGATG